MSVGGGIHFIKLKSQGFQWNRKAWTWISAHWILDANSLKIVKDFGIRKAYKGVATRKEFNAARKASDAPKYLSFISDDRILRHHWRAGAWIEAVRGNKRYSNNISTRSDDLNWAVSHPGGRQFAIMFYGDKTKTRRLSMIGLAGGKFVLLSKKSYKDEPRGVMRAPGRNGVLALFQKSFKYIPWPGNSLFATFEQIREGEKFIKAGFKEEGMEIFLKSMENGAQAWEKKLGVLKKTEHAGR